MCLARLRSSRTQKIKEKHTAYQKYFLNSVLKKYRRHILLKGTTFIIKILLLNNFNYLDITKDVWLIRIDLSPTVSCYTDQIC